MRAFRYHSTGAALEARLEDVPVPAAAAGEVLVRVRFASVNPVDWKIAGGAFRFLVRGGLPRTMGSDFAGEVAAVGAGVQGFRRGQRVWGFVDPFKRPQGTFAEYCPVPASHAFVLPDAVPDRDAAALACVGATAVTLCELGRVGQGSRVLVNGASGGVGHLAVQVARNRGARVTGVASAGRREFVTSLGATEFVDYRATPPERWPGGNDAVFDCVPNLPRRVHARLLVRGGRYVTTLPDAATFLVDPLTNLLGRVRRRGVLLAPSAAAMDELTAAFERGRLTCQLDAEFELADVARAVARSRSGHVVGKVVVRVD